MRIRNKPYNPARYLIGGFMAVILAGSLLLTLPAATRGDGIGYLDALFTATSAVCVTGLVVVDTGTFFSPLGQAVIMILIFIGSLGFMTMATLIFIFLGRRISLRDRLVVKEALNQETMTNLVPLVTAVVRMAVILELAGAAVMSIRFVPELGWGRGIFYGLFHAVSAFGNAGFDLFGNFDSLTRFPTDYLVNGMILALLIIGGLGFTVIFDLFKCVRHRCRPSLHTRMAVMITLILLLLGTAAVLALESKNPETMGALSPGGKLFAALFTAATPRTAGFSVLGTGAHYMPTLVIIMALMFIGASPASTGGGVKTTTFGAVVIALVALIRGQEEPVLFRRRLPLYQIFKAVAIIGGAITLVFFATFLLTMFERQSFIALLFETVSAFGTVGLSLGITPELSAPGKAVLIFTMFSGRLGPLTMLVALARRKKEEGLNYPEEKLLIG
ncbi:MAG: TrkH family potassium uptake protein [Bacillota bacterium]